MRFIRKNFKKNILISLIIILLISCISKNSIAINKQNILVTGRVTDKGNNNISGVEVSFIDTSTNALITTATTDITGEYIVNIPAGKYKVEFKYPKNYNTNKINVRKYKLYDKNFELGLVYNNEIEDKKIKYFDAKFTEDSYDFRIIKNPYEKDNEIENQIHSLQLNSESDHAFHNLIYEGHKGVTLILADKQEDEIKKYINNYLNGDYNTIICKPQESMSNLIDKIYAKLKINPNILNTEAIGSKTDNSATTVEIELSSTTIIDSNVGNSGGGGHTPNDDSSNFISGQIKVGNELHKQKVTIKLLDTNTGKVKDTVYTDDGKYYISYPGAGKYKLEYEFENTNEFNGQYYEANIKSSNNCMTETNRTNINKYYKSINYEREKQLDNYSNTIPEKIKGESDIFDVQSTSKKIVKNVLLKERDKFSLTIEENVNKFNIILGNGQTFKNYDLKNNPNNENYKMRLFNITMQDKLSYGAKLLVEYEIKVTNSSNINCKGYTIINRFENLEFNKNEHLLSDTKRINGDDWKVINKSDVESLTGGIDLDDDTELITYLKLETAGINANSEQTYYITLTRLLDAENASTIFNGRTELVEYKNTNGRRNYENINLTGNVMNRNN